MRHKDSVRISVKANTYIFFVLLLFLIPIPWLLAWVTAVFLHELSHYMAVRILGGNIYHITVSIGGMDMQTSPLTDGRHLIAILSGPIGGFLPVLFARQIPRLAVCCWILTLYNLLPLLPLDGGRMWEILLGRRQFFYVLQKILLGMLICGAVYAAVFLKLGILPLTIIGTLCVRNRKIPCKRSLCKVQ